MVRINRVYTKTGDDGTTALVGGARVAKDGARIEAYGTVDELNAVIGMCVSALAKSPAENILRPILLRVQNELFDLGAELATPDAERRKEQPRIQEHHVDALEKEIDAQNEELEALRSFVLPGGGEPATRLHLARTVCRRAERHVVSLAKRDGADSVGQVVPYLNRLSDALFVFSRFAAHKEGIPEVLWKPGGA